MDHLVLVHIIAISFWLGVVSVEVIIERARIDRNSIVRLHQLVDRFVELPTITVVFISGMLLWSRTSWSLDILPKALLGIGAVFLNAICYYFVEKRAVEGSNFQQQSARILWVTIPAVFCFIGAAYLGGSHANWW